MVQFYKSTQPPYIFATHFISINFANLFANLEKEGMVVGSPSGHAFHSYLRRSEHHSLSYLIRHHHQVRLESKRPTPKFRTFNGASPASLPRASHCLYRSCFWALPVFVPRRDGRGRTGQATSTSPQSSDSPPSLPTSHRRQGVRSPRSLGRSDIGAREADG